MQHVRCCPAPERLMSSHAAAAHDWSDGRVFRHKKLARATNKLVFYADLLEEMSKWLDIRLIAAGSEAVSNGKDAQRCSAAYRSQGRQQHGHAWAHFTRCTNRK